MSFFCLRDIVIWFYFGVELFYVFCFFCFTSFVPRYSQKEPKFPFSCAWPLMLCKPGLKLFNSVIFVARWKFNNACIKRAYATQQGLSETLLNNNFREGGTEIFKAKMDLKRKCLLYATIQVLNKHICNFLCIFYRVHFCVSNKLPTYSSQLSHIYCSV